MTILYTYLEFLKPVLNGIAEMQKVLLRKIGEASAKKHDLMTVLDIIGELLREISRYTNPFEKLECSREKQADCFMETALDFASHSLVRFRKQLDPPMRKKEFYELLARFIPRLVNTAYIISCKDYMFYSSCYLNNLKFIENKAEKLSRLAILNVNEFLAIVKKIIKDIDKKEKTLEDLFLYLGQAETIEKLLLPVLSNCLEKIVLPFSDTIGYFMRFMIQNKELLKQEKVKKVMRALETLYTPDREIFYNWLATSLKRKEPKGLYARVYLGIYLYEVIAFNNNIIAKHLLALESKSVDVPNPVDFILAGLKNLEVGIRINEAIAFNLVEAYLSLVSHPVS